MRRTTLLFLAMLLAFAAKGQDIHFSQSDSDPVLLNPAYAGFFQGTARFGLAYRNQWASVSYPYKTFALSAETALMRNRFHHNGIGAALLAFRDRSGTLNYGTTQVGLALSYYQSPNHSGNHYLSLAMEADYGQNGYSTDRLVADNPINDFMVNSRGYFTFGAGLAWFYETKGGVTFRAGLACRNINEPSINFLESYDVHLTRHYTFHLRSEIEAGDHLSVLPMVSIQKQGKYSQYVIGSDVRYGFDNILSGAAALSAGMAWRVGDALLFDITAEYEALLLTLYYDANISFLRQASNTIGAFEITLVYRLGNAISGGSGDPSHRKAIPCPIL